MSSQSSALAAVAAAAAVPQVEQQNITKGEMFNPPTNEVNVSSPDASHGPASMQEGVYECAQVKAEGEDEGVVDNSSAASLKRRHPASSNERRIDTEEKAQDLL